MATVIQVESLWKQYRLGLIGHRLLYREVQSWWARLRGKEDPNRPVLDPLRGTNVEGDRIWALQDVSLEVSEGEVFGLIGRNGAGKSTLLKILSRVTAPTKGIIKVRGRVASLLEVGTGFHPELTGRENIFLNGAILGMTVREIRGKFDEIVDFSGVEKFIDTPVKRYSSGMYVRLAFAVAAHLDPEVLVVDEVLAVGDAEFGKKCIGKMDSVAQSGRTVLLVTHNLFLATHLCSRVALIDKGKIVSIGSPESIVGLYLKENSGNNGEIVWSDAKTSPGNDAFRFHSVRICGTDGTPTSEVMTCEEVTVELLYWNLVEGARIVASIWLKHQTGALILTSANLPSLNSAIDPWATRPFPAGLFRSTVRIPADFLNNSGYTISAALAVLPSLAGMVLEDILSFEAHDSGEMRKDHPRDMLGLIRVKVAWNTEYLEP